jgi:ribosome maturation factor RimP
MSQPIAAVRELLAPVVAGCGADLEDLSISKAGSRSVVRVVIDRDGGLDLDAVAEVSHAVSAALDVAADVLRGSFVLEVSTPGVDRPLTEPRHWRRATGRLVKVTRRAGGSIIARVLSAGSESVVLADPASGTKTELAYPEVSRAVMQVEFDSPRSASAGARGDALGAS